jgi:uncharacterized membrane protein
MLGTACGLALACGINAYLPLFVLGLLARSGNVSLQSGFSWLQTPLVLVGLLCLALLDVVADKIPGLDHAWDVPHTLARPLAAVLCVAAVLSTQSDVARVLIALVGGALGGSVHTSKAAARLASTSGGGGVPSLPISIGEDIIVVLLLVLSFATPKVSLALAAVTLALLIWFAPTMVHILRLQWHVLRRLRDSLTGATSANDPADARQRSLFAAPRWAILAGNAITGPDEPLRSAQRVTIHGAKLPRHGWLLVTEKRLLLVGQTITRHTKLYEAPLLYIRVARLERGLLFPALHLLDLDGNRLRIRLIDADDTLIHDVAEATLASSPADALTSLPDPRGRFRRIG